MRHSRMVIHGSQNVCLTLRSQNNVQYPWAISTTSCVTKRVIMAPYDFPDYHSKSSSDTCSKVNRNGKQNLDFMSSKGNFAECMAMLRPLLETATEQIVFGTRKINLNNVITVDGVVPGAIRREARNVAGKYGFLIHFSQQSVVKEPVLHPSIILRYNTIRKQVFKIIEERGEDFTMTTLANSNVGPIVWICAKFPEEVKTELQRKVHVLGLKLYIGPSEIWSSWDIHP